MILAIQLAVHHLVMILAMILVIQLAIHHLGINTRAHAPLNLGHVHAMMIVIVVTIQDRIINDNGIFLGLELMLRLGLDFCSIGTPCGGEIGLGACKSLRGASCWCRSVFREGLGCRAQVFRRVVIPSGASRCPWG